MGRDSRKERGQMGSGFRQDQSLPETPLHPKLASSGDTDSGRGAGRTRPAGGRTGVHIGLSPQHTPCLGHPWLRRELSAGLMEGGVGASRGSVPTLAAPVLPPEVCSTPITPVPPSPTSSGTATAPPSALAPPQAHLVLGEKQDNPPRSLCDLPNKPPGKTPSLLALQEPASTPARPGNYPARATGSHSSSTGPACSPVITRLPHGPCAHLPGPALHCPSRRILATLPWSAPSSPPPTLPRLRKDQSSPRGLGDDSLSFRFRLT